VRVNPGPPAAALAGESDVRVAAAGGLVVALAMVEYPLRLPAASVARTW
jgi:hypothetical protein